MERSFGRGSKITKAPETLEETMAEVKRWRVTYTKHLKQKRKVYHDGVLVLNSSIGKVKLYDESETLLECKILKDGEVVRSSETLTFNAYLVDIGDPDGEGQHVNNSKNSPLQRKKFTNPSVSADKKIKVEKSEVCSVSPSQKIIREFKKRELHKYVTLQSSPDSSKASTSATSGWHVLYTTQLTKKAKKYHDGFVRCPESRSLGRQVMLYDEDWKLLESRFLKKGEEVRSGETMEFHGHLVEIGDLKENRKTFPDLPPKENRFSSFRKLEMPKQHKNTNAGKSVEKEWQVLYTTQVTQKAKKYHDGFLSLVICGSLGRQVMLYDASRKLIESRFLNKDEIIQSGDSIAFDAHLVDIGETEVREVSVVDLDNIGRGYGVVPETRTRHVKCESAEVIQSIERDKSPVKVKTVSTVGGSTCSEISKSGCTVPKDKPLRNAFGILSILQRPVTEGASDRGCKSLESSASADKEIQESDAHNVDSPDDTHLQSALQTEAGSGAKFSGSADTEKLPSSIFKAEGQGVKTGFTKGSKSGGSDESPANVQTDCSSHAKPFDTTFTSSAIRDEAGPSFDLGF